MEPVDFDTKTVSITNETQDLFQYFGVDSANARLSKYRNYLRVIPTNIILPLKKHGLKIVFYKRRISLYKQIRDEVNMYEPISSIDGHKHLFNPNTNSIYLEYSRIKEITFLHELGHAVDFNLSYLLDQNDYLSDSIVMDKIRIQAKLNTLQVLRSSFSFSYGKGYAHFVENNNEVFAELFACYFSSNPKHKQDLERLFPDFVEFLELILERL